MILSFEKIYTFKSPKFQARMNSSITSSGPIYSTIETKLTEAFKPTHLEIINESYMHNVPKGSETHFKVVVVSEKFNDMKPLIKRHRAINEILAEELKTGVHALSIVAKSPAQWNPDSTIDPSPNCRGGFGK